MMKAHSRRVVAQHLWYFLLTWRSEFAECFRSRLSKPIRGHGSLSCTQSSEGRPAIHISLIDIDDDHPSFPDAVRSLRLRGFDSVDVEIGPSETLPAQGSTDRFNVGYRFHRASGMLQLFSKPSDEAYDLALPQWIPIVSDMETVLINNGWSFLDPDESEPMSAFDVDAANLEGTYRPKWGAIRNTRDEGGGFHLSSLGFDIVPLTKDEVSACARSLKNDLTISTLLKGATDPPRLKKTCNNFDFAGAAGQSDLQHGIFSCAIGGLPLFSTVDIMPTTASSGWLSFKQPIAKDHVIHVCPDVGSLDQRVEVLCAKSRCHLGHYFGRSGGYCINASSLNFIPQNAGSVIEGRSPAAQSSGLMLSPISWRFLDTRTAKSHHALRDICLRCAPVGQIVLGAGCFWHVEEAFLRLPGVVNTTVGYAGGNTANPTYEHVCQGSTAHAEVVHVMFDSSVLQPRMLIDAFLALHDPTKIRAHGKHTPGTGQYRSSIFALNENMAQTANDALRICSQQLQRELSTEVRVMGGPVDSWVWVAEDRHQRHEDRKSGEIIPKTLSWNDWLEKYGRRPQSVLGSSETMTAASG